MASDYPQMLALILREVLDTRQGPSQPDNCPVAGPMAPVEAHFGAACPIDPKVGTHTGGAASPVPTSMCVSGFTQRGAAFGAGSSDGIRVRRTSAHPAPARACEQELRTRRFVPTLGVGTFAQTSTSLFG